VKSASRALIVASLLAVTTACVPTEQSTTQAPPAVRIVSDPSEEFAGIAVDVASRDASTVAVGVLDSDLRIWMNEGPGRPWRAIDPERINDPSTSSGFLAVAGGRPGFSIVGQQQSEGPFRLVAWVSPDGLEWSSVDSPSLVSAGDMFVADMIWAEDHFVAVGTATVPNQSDNTDVVVLVSPDGVAWTRIDDESLRSGDAIIMHAVGSVDSTLVAAGHVNFEGADLFTSDDGGRSWDRTSPRALEGATVRSIAAIEGGLLLGGCVDGNGDGTGVFEARIWRSTNGPDGPFDEVRLADDGARSCVVDLASVGPESIAVGYVEDDAAMWSSRDGEMWVRVDLPTGGYTETGLSGVSANGARVVAAGSGLKRDAGQGSPPHALILERE
jgi:hypothetical protein